MALQKGLEVILWPTNQLLLAMDQYLLLAAPENYVKSQHLNNQNRHGIVPRTL